MEQKFSNNSIDLQVLREFCECEGKMVEYRNGEQLEREGDPARWFGFVTEGCFKYVNHSSDDREHYSVVPALLSILPCKTSPRSFASPCRCSPKFAKTSLSEHKNSIFTKIH